MARHISRRMNFSFALAKLRFADLSKEEAWDSIPAVAVHEFLNFWMGFRAASNSKAKPKRRKRRGLRAGHLCSALAVGRRAAIPFVAMAPFRACATETSHKARSEARSIPQYSYPGSGLPCSRSCGSKDGGALASGISSSSSKLTGDAAELTVPKATGLSDSDSALGP